MLYDDGIACKEIFKNWYKKTTDLRTNYKNMLSKHLQTSLWGSLVKMKKSYYTEEEYKELDVCDDGKSQFYPVGDTLFACHSAKLQRSDFTPLYHRFECIDISKPYKTSFARLKPFLLSLSRNVVGNTIIKNNILVNVIRIHTDGIVLNREFDFTKFEILGLIPIAEEKTSGLINWINTNNGLKLCNKCQSRYKFTDKHLCCVI